MAVLSDAGVVRNEAALRRLFNSLDLDDDLFIDGERLFVDRIQ